MTDVVVVDPADTDLFGRWHAALRAGQLAGRPPAPFFSVDQYLLLHTSPESLAKRGRVALAAVAGGEVVGAAELSLPQRYDTATVSVDLAVPVEHRGRGVGGALWSRALAHPGAHERATLEAEVDVPVGLTLEQCPGGAFALSRGFTSRNAEDHFALALPVDRALVDPVRPAPTGYRLTSWVGECPEEHVQAYAELQTAMALDAPHGELEREERRVTVADVRSSERSLRERGFDILTTMAFPTGGGAAGYSLVFVGDNDLEHVHQDDTLVAREHRGHGLGLAMKLCNHRLLDERYPDRRWIHTWTVIDNAPMQRVNRALGYRAVETNHELALDL